MKFKKAAIIMTIVPAMFFAGCAKNEQQQQEQEQVASVANALNDSYAQAKANGYTGTYEEWVKLVELNQTNPQQAAAQAKSSGYDGFDMLMAGAMGMMLGNMMSKPSYNSYKSSSYYNDDRRAYGNGSAPARHTSSYVPSSSTTKATSSSGSFSKSSASTSVSRGGFGGAVSSGG